MVPAHSLAAARPSASLPAWAAAPAPLDAAQERSPILLLPVHLRPPPWPPTVVVGAGGPGHEASGGRGEPQGCVCVHRTGLRPPSLEGEPCSPIVLIPEPRRRMEGGHSEEGVLEPLLRGHTPWEGFMLPSSSRPASPPPGPQPCGEGTAPGSCPGRACLQTPIPPAGKLTWKAFLTQSPGCTARSPVACRVCSRATPQLRGCRTWPGTPWVLHSLGGSQGSNTGLPDAVWGASSATSLPRDALQGQQAAMCRPQAGPRVPPSTAGPQMSLWVVCCLSRCPPPKPWCLWMRPYWKKAYL